MNGTFVDADSDATNPNNSFLGPQNVNVGTDVWFKVVLDNIGNITLKGVDVVDVNRTGGEPGTTFDLMVDGELTLNAVTNYGASLAGDTDGDNQLDVNEVWTITYKQGFDPGQHINTATVITDEGVTAKDDAFYYSLVNDGPGVRTPGFWSNLGANLWNGVLDPVGQVKVGPTFAEDDLLIAGNTDGSKDSNGDGFITAADKGLLIGDFNMNGVTDAGEDTFFIGYNDAKQLINASQKTVSGDGVQMLGRDVVATWLNFLAGNAIENSPANAGDDPKHFISDAVDWMQTWGGKSGNGATQTVKGQPDPLLDNVKTETFDIYDPNHAPVKTNTVQWQTAQFAGDPHSAAQMHNALDDYNNSGMIDGVTYAHDADDAAFASALGIAQSASYGSGASTMEDNGALVVMI